MPGLILTLLMKYAAFSILELMSLIALPPLGFGTYRVPAASAADVVCAAIAAGWRHIGEAFWGRQGLIEVAIS